MRKNVAIALLATVFCGLVLMVGIRISRKPQELPFQNLQTILEEEHLDADYEVLSFPGLGGPYRKLKVQRFFPGEKLEGSVTVGHLIFTFREREVDSNSETIFIFLQDETQAVGIAVLKPKKSEP